MNILYTNAQNDLHLKPLAAGLAFVFGVSAALAGHATTRIVNNCNDSGVGSLRDTVAGARSGDTIDLTTLTCSTISLTTGELHIAVDDLALQGPGANALTIAGPYSIYGYSVLSHSGHGTLRIDALSIASGSDTCVYSPGTVYLTRSTVTACRNGVVANGFSARDSTISNNVYGVQTLDGDVSITGSTISGNVDGLLLGRSSTVGVAVAQITNTTISGNSAFNGYGAGTIFDRVTISNSTIAFNHSRASGGGFGFFGPEVTIESSIFAHNDGFDLVAGGRFGLPAPGISGHNNLIMAANVAVPADTIKTDPQLLPLADNGGPTWTHALSPGSPAIDAGNNSAVLATDQRGAAYARVAGAARRHRCVRDPIECVAKRVYRPGFHR